MWPGDQIVTVFNFSPFIEVFNPATNEWRGLATHDAGGGQPRSRAGHCAIRHRVHQQFLDTLPHDIEYKTHHHYHHHHQPE